MKKIFNSLVLCFLLSLLMVSCRGLFEAKVENTPDGKCLVTGAVNNPYDAGESRSATSSVDGKDFYYVISGKYSTASETEILYENTNKNFSLEIDKGTWDFYVDVYLVDTGSTSYAAANLIFTGKLLNKIISENSENLTFTLELNTDGIGTLNLPVIVDDSINSCFITRTNLTTPEFHTESFNVTDADGVKKIIISSTPEAGFYSIKMDFYSGPLDEGNVTGSFLYSTTELITLFNGTTITKWDYTDGKLIIDSQRIKKTQNHTIYVNKNSTVSTNGTIFSPFSTLKQAVDYVNQVNDATESGAQSAYSIILQTDEAAADEIFINGNSHPLNLTIKSAESAFSSISGSSSKENTIRIATSTSSNLSVTFKDVVVGKSSKTGIAYEKTEGSSLSIGISGYTYINTIKGNVDGVVEVLSDIEKIYVNNMDDIVEANSAAAKKEVSSFSYVPWDTTTTAAVITIPASSVFYDYIDIIETGTDSYELNSQGKLVIIDGSVKQLRKLPAAGSTVFVNDADDLFALASFVNTGEYTRASGRVINLGGSNSFSGITVEQKNDIAIPSGKNWEPIGYKENLPFSGTYDGANLKISSFSIKSNSSTEFSYNFLGLFGCVKNGTVKNVNLSGAISLTGNKDSDYLFYLGSIVALLSNGTVHNCTSNVNILNSLNNYQNGCGGIVGKTIDSSNVISNCINTNALNSLTQDTYNVGGIVGNVSGATEVYNCINKASVSNSSKNSSSCASGIAGRISGASVKVFNCYNSGSVTGFKYAAGIVGYCGNFSGTEILNCISEGSIGAGSPDCLGQIVCFDSSNNGSFVTVNYVYYLDPKGEKSYTNVSRLDLCCKGFTLNDPVDIWYGTLNNPFTILSKYTKALVFFLNGWIKTNNTASKYNTWCVTSGELGFGNAPTDEPEEEYSQYLSSLTFNPDKDSSNEADKTVYVKTAADLKALADFVNTGKNEAGFEITDPTFAGITIIQEDDIDLSELKESDGVTKYNWVPVGRFNSSTSETKYFKGIYDGGNKKITGLKLNTSIDNAPGLFGNVAQPAEIKNVDVSGEIICSEICDVGGLVCILDKGAVNNCTSSINVTSTSTYQYSGGVGGIVGKVSTSASVYNCVNKGKISSSGIRYVAGIIGYIKNNNTETSVYNCINEGDIESSSSDQYRYVGGIVGCSASKTVIENCNNKGDVSGQSKLKGNAAGIIGYIDTTANFYINNSINTGTISSFEYNYAIIGNEAPASSIGATTITNCFSSNLSLDCGSTNITKNNCSLFNISTNDGVLATKVYDSSSLLNALNKWISNSSTPDKYYKWAYDTTNGFHFGTPTTPPALDGPAMSEVTTKPTAGDKIYITSAEDLVLLAEKVNGYSSWDMKGVYIIQTADIDLKDTSDWSPIGKDSANAFKGNYDGGGKLIKNLKISTANTTSVPALFGYVNDCDSLIENINLSGEIKTASKNVAGLINTVSSGTVHIKNCTVNVNIENTASGGSDQCYVGGFVSSNTNYDTAELIIEDCVNLSQIKISGRTHATGGFVGYNSTGTIKIYNSINNGSIEYTSNLPKQYNIYEGGFIGKVILNDTTQRIYIINCANKGNITGASITVESKDPGANASYSAGFIGCYNYTSSYVLKNCFNSGSITGANNNGAIIGADKSNTPYYFYCLYWSDELTYWNAKNSSGTDSMYQLLNFSLSNSYKYNESLSLWDGSSFVSADYLIKGLNSWPLSEDYTDESSAPPADFVFKPWSNSTGSTSATSGEPFLAIELTP